MENLNFSSNIHPQHLETLDIIDKNIKGLKLIIRDSYKRIKCSNEKEQEILYDDFDKIFQSICEIHKDSFKLDDMLVWDSFLEASDNDKMDQLEKKCYDEFIFASQVGRGKIQKIKEFNNNIKTFSEIPPMKVNKEDKEVRMRSNTFEATMGMDMDIDL